MGTRRFRAFGLVFVGVLAGLLISLTVSAVAQRGGVPLPLRELQQFANVFSAIKSSYVEPVGDDELINEAIKGMFNELDPHSTYLDAEAFKDMESMTQGGFGGLGIEIGLEKGRPKVISPIEDTPAARAGILAGDIITHIDGEPTQDMGLNGAVKRMRGEPQTSITLTIKRVGVEEPFEVEIVRDHIRVQSVRGNHLDDGLIYVRISQFQERTASDLIKKIHELGADEEPTGLVLDLRNDPGGLLESAIGVSSVFLDKGDLVVSTKGRIPSANREYYVRPLAQVLGAAHKSMDLLEEIQWVQELPMVVLINAGSASASEIVAGALQDHGRATVIGNRSFGKGSVQSILPLDDESGIKLTTALYYTPKGRSIQVTGVEPDIYVDDTAQGNLFRIPREGDLKRHLHNENGSLEAEDEGEYVKEPKMFEFGGEDDFQLMQAVNYLQGREVKKSDPELVAQQSAGDEAEKKTNKSVSTAKERGRSALPTRERRYRITPEGVTPVEIN